MCLAKCSFRHEGSFCKMIKQRLGGSQLQTRVWRLGSLNFTLASQSQSQIRPDFDCLNCRLKHPKSGISKTRLCCQYLVGCLTMATIRLQKATPSCGDKCWPISGNRLLCLPSGTRRTRTFHIPSCIVHPSQSIGQTIRKFMINYPTSNCFVSN